MYVKKNKDFRQLMSPQLFLLNKAYLQSKFNFKITYDIQPIKFCYFINYNNLI